MRKDQRTLGLALVALLAASGCRFDTTLDAKGGATIKVAYRLGKDSSLAKVKRSFLSPNIKIVSATMDKDMHANVEIAIDDVTKLSTAQMFAKLKTSRTVDKDGTVVLEGKIINKQPMKVTKEVLDYFGREVAVSVTAPGEIVDTNASAKDGKTATWKWPTEELFTQPEMVLRISYRAPVHGAGS